MSHSPFLDVSNFTAEETPALPMRSAAPSRSPFLSVYELEGETAAARYDDPAREAYAALVDELHDEEFDEALYELQSHARALHDEQLCMGSPRSTADRLLTQHFAQLIDESEAVVDAMARKFGSRDESGLVDHELDSFLDGYAPSTPLEPEFEDFFGKLVKKIGKVAKAAVGTAWKGIKSVGLAALFGRLRAILNPILNGVLQRALGSLPPAVRPAAQKLAEKLGFAQPKPAAAAAPMASAPEPSADAVDAAAAAASDGASAAVQEPAGADTGAQQELDELVASAFLAQDEDELNLDAARIRNEYGSGGTPVFAELDDAREQFIQELNDLREGESAEPHIQSFLPAVLPALKLGMRLIGRGRVVGFLSPLLAKLIGKLIGPGQAPALSRAIVDAGLRLLSLEMSESEQAGLAGSAVAATVEETVGRIASLPDYVLDNQELLEGFALEAFEQAAAANLPAVFSEATYRQRPELLEGGVNASWVLMPLRGRKRYKRCSKVFKVRVSPHVAEEVESFEAAPLAEYLEDQLGLPANPDMEAEVHLYEALPGTTLADIARGESETFGSGLSHAANAQQLHPLTPQASSALLGRPGLGRMASLDPRRISAGQRFYHMSFPGRRPLSTHGHAQHGQRARLRRRFHLNATLDSVQDQVRVCLFLSEVKAQKLAVRVRQQANVGAVAAEFHRAIARRLQRIFGASGALAQRRLRIVHAAMPPGQAAGAAMRNLPASLASAFAAKLKQSLVQGFVEFVRTQAQPLLAATQDPADGITLLFTIDRPAGLKELCQAMSGKGVDAASVAQAIAAGAAPQVRVSVVPGHRCA